MKNDRRILCSGVSKPSDAWLPGLTAGPRAGTGAETLLSGVVAIPRVGPAAFSGGLLAFTGAAGSDGFAGVAFAGPGSETLLSGAVAIPCTGSAAFSG